MLDAGGERVVRETPLRQRADEWALVLTAAGITGRLDESGGLWHLAVAAADGEVAAAALDAFDRDSIERAAPTPTLEWGPTLAGLAMGMLLVVSYAVTGPANAMSAWHRRGSASATAIAGGEVWRAVTALTLHVDLVHLAGNVLAIVVFGSAVCRLLGPGVGALLILAAGFGGNIATAVLHGASYTAVGASTAVFGAVGVLSGLSAARRRAGRHTWTALGAGLALLALLGTGERADLGGHLFGFIGGGSLGLATGALGVPPLDRMWQWALALTAAGAVAGCWVVALR